MQKLSTPPDSNDKLETNISVRSFCKYRKEYLLDVRVFYSQLQKPITNNDQNDGKPENGKYNQQILNGENGCFTSLVFTSNGEMSTETKQF